MFVIPALFFIFQSLQERISGPPKPAEDDGADTDTGADTHAGIDTHADTVTHADAVTHAEGFTPGYPQSTLSGLRIGQPTSTAPVQP